MPYSEKINIAILTVSNTRTSDTDKSGQIIFELLEKNGLKVIDYQICRDDVNLIQKIVDDWIKCKNKQINAIITTGGTGIAKEDNTIEAIQPLFNKQISGFGELFRFLSFTEDVGTRVMLSRATAGIVQGKVVFILPGASRAVSLAMERLIVPEIHHLVYEATKHLNKIM